MQVAVDPDEGLLYQVLGPLTVADHPVDEGEEAGPVACQDLAESALVAGEIPGNERDWHRDFAGPSPES